MKAKASPLALLDNLSTQSRLLLLTSLFTILAGLIAALGINNAVRYNEQLSLLNQAAQELNRVADARAALLKQQLALKNILLAEGDSQQFSGEGPLYSSQFWAYLDHAWATTDDLSDQAYSRLESLSDTRVEYEDAYWNAEDLAYQGDLTSALQTSQNKLDPLANVVDDLLIASMRDNSSAIQGTVDNLENTVQQTTVTGRWAMLSLAAIVILAIFMTSHITRPLHALTNAIVAFENNTFRSEMLEPYMARRDELGQLAKAVHGMAHSIQEANQIKEQFINSASRFIPTQYLEFLEKQDITEVRLGDHVAAEMAVMFSDIRGFTSLSEKMSAKENFDFINEYLKLVSPIIQSHEGFIVKFLGDGMMAIFPYGVEDAVQAGIEKQKKVVEFNALLARRGLPAVSVGIGIHTGQMMVGMVGEELRMQGDAFSDNVNLTARVEGLNKFYGSSMIISEDTLQQIKSPAPFRMRYLGKAIVKGRIAPLGLYEVYEGMPEAFATLKDATRADFERGVQFFTTGRLPEARNAFNSVLDRDPGDKTARYYMERSSELMEKGLPQNWNGAIIMDAK